jgi:long-chain acyl-CoA synthetase
VMQVVAEVSPDVFIGVPRFYEKLYEGLRARIEAEAPLRRRVVETCWALGRRMSRFKLNQQVPPLALRVAHAAADWLVLRRIRSIMGSRLRVMVTGSAPAPKHLLEEFHALGWLVLEAYGLSENVVPMAMNRMDAFRFGTVGRALAANEIVIAVDGSVKVRGAGLFRGYLGQEAKPSTSVDGFYTTGDMGHLDKDGYLSLIGRNNELIKTSTGRRVAPAAVEACLSSVSGVDQTVLIGSGRKILVAICTVTEAHLAAPARIRLVSALRQQVALINEYERPKAIVLVEESLSIESGELTSNLKVRRQEVEARRAALIEALYKWLEKNPTGTLPSGVAVLVPGDLAMPGDAAMHKGRLDSTEHIPE